jgi:hypothetical protein
VDVAVSTGQPASAADAAGHARRIGGGLLAAVALYAVALGLWLGLLPLASPPARLLEGLAEFERGQSLYQWSFVGASLLAPAFVSILLLLAAAAEVPAISTRRALAVVLLAAYVPFTTFAYTSQYTFLPGLVRSDPRSAALWYFHDVDSIPYTLALTGYALLGLASVLLASALAERGRRWLAGWLAPMGALSVVAFALHAAGGIGLGGIISLVSAALTVPIVVLAAAEGRRLRSHTDRRIPSRPA